jgi:pyruvate kinase
MAVTKSGYTARRMSKFRPDIMIIGATPYEKTYHQLSLTWGVQPLMANYRSEVEDLFSHCIRQAIRQKLLKEGDGVVLSAGVPLDVSGNTNIIRVMNATMEGADE